MKARGQLGTIACEALRENYATALIAQIAVCKDLSTQDGACIGRKESRIKAPILPGKNCPKRAGARTLNIASRNKLGRGNR